MLATTPRSARGSSSPERLWFPYRRPSASASVRLFCFPQAGGGASSYLAWPAACGPEIEVCAVQLPGRETRAVDRPYTRLTSLCEDLTRAMEPLLDRPFALFGHGAGALVAFVVARTLRREAGAVPVHLFVSAQRAPDLPDRARPMHLLPREDLLAEIGRRSIHRPTLLDDASLADLLLPILRADLELAESYHHVTEPALRAPITAFGGDADPATTQVELLRWSAHTRRAFASHTFAGGPRFVTTERARVVLAVRRALNPDAADERLP